MSFYDSSNTHSGRGNSAGHNSGQTHGYSHWNGFDDGANKGNYHTPSLFSSHVIDSTGLERQSSVDSGQIKTDFLITEDPFALPKTNSASKLFFWRSKSRSSSRVNSPCASPLASPMMGEAPLPEWNSEAAVESLGKIDGVSDMGQGHGYGHNHGKSNSYHYSNNNNYVNNNNNNNSKYDYLQHGRGVPHTPRFDTYDDSRGNSSMSTPVFSSTDIGSSDYNSRGHERDGSKSKPKLPYTFAATSIQTATLLVTMMVVLITIIIPQGVSADSLSSEKFPIKYVPPSGTYTNEVMPAAATTTPVACSAPSDPAEELDDYKFDVNDITSCIAFCYDNDNMYALTQDLDCACMTSDMVVGTLYAVNTAECFSECDGFICGNRVSNRWSVYNTGFNPSDPEVVQENITASSSTTTINVTKLSDHQKSITTGREVGAIVGSIIGFIIIIGLLVFFYYSRKNKEKKLVKATEDGCALDDKNAGENSKSFFFHNSTSTTALLAAPNGHERGSSSGNTSEAEESSYKDESKPADKSIVSDSSSGKDVELSTPAVITAAVTVANSDAHKSNDDIVADDSHEGANILTSPNVGDVSHIDTSVAGINHGSSTPTSANPTAKPASSGKEGKKNKAKSPKKSSASNSPNKGNTPSLVTDKNVNNTHQIGSSQPPSANSKTATPFPEDVFREGKPSQAFAILKAPRGAAPKK